MRSKATKMNIEINNQIAEVDIKYGSRKSVVIKITPEGKVVIYVPKNANYNVIEDILVSKTEWIEKALAKVDGLCVLSVRKYLENKWAIPIRGQFYPVETELGLEDSCTMEKDILKIKTTRNNLEHLIFMVEGYLKTLAEQTIRDKVKEFAEVMEVFPEKCIVKTQKKRWGTCSSRRELRFNWKCIMLKDDLIDYIVVHELCHLKQMNHSSDFWNEVEYRIPDYKSRRNALKKYIISLD